MRPRSGHCTARRWAPGTRSATVAPPRGRRSRRIRAPPAGSPGSRRAVVRRRCCGRSGRRPASPGRGCGCRRRSSRSGTGWRGLAGRRCRRSGSPRSADRHGAAQRPCAPTDPRPDRRCGPAIPLRCRVAVSSGRSAAPRRIATPRPTNLRTPARRSGRRTPAGRPPAGRRTSRRTTSSPRRLAPRTATPRRGSPWTSPGWGRSRQPGPGRMWRWCARGRRRSSRWPRPS